MDSRRVPVTSSCLVLAKEEQLPQKICPCISKQNTVMFEAILAQVKSATLNKFELANYEISRKLLRNLKFVYIIVLQSAPDVILFNKDKRIWNNKRKVWSKKFEKSSLKVKSLTNFGVYTIKSFHFNLNFQIKLIVYFSLNRRKCENE